jgi:hypothetical protein
MPASSERLKVAKPMARSTAAGGRKRSPEMRAFRAKQASASTKADAR